MADTLALWHPTLDQPLPGNWLAWGDAPRGSSADVTFRVRNQSGTYTAKSVMVTVADTGTTATPSVAAQHLLSTDGQTFTAALNLGDLPAGATSRRLTLRRVTATDAQLGLYTFTLTAAATAWK